MEESPHKCQVCNRSFNQRSNLKTHLLTHTDHKPYECVTCRKVFRRNCDLRRHALTHTIGGGDMPPELNENGNDSINEKVLNDDENDDTNDVEDEFDDIQVDSPVNERNTPSPVIPDCKAIDIESVKDEIKCENDVDGEPPRKMPRLEQKDDGEFSGITHCHHNGGQTHYTMRPQQMISNGLAFDGMLHVRRDLHYKVDTPITIHSSIASATTTSSTIGVPVPFRKRSAGFAYETHIEKDHTLVSSSHLVPLNASPLNLTNHTSAKRSRESPSGK